MKPIFVAIIILFYHTSSAQLFVDTFLPANSTLQKSVLINKIDSNKYSLQFNEDTNVLNLFLIKDSLGNWQYANQSKEKIQVFFGDAFSFDSSIFSTPNTITILLNKKKQFILYTSTPTKIESNNLLTPWWYLIPVGLFGALLGYLIFLKMNKNNTKMQKPEFVTNLQNIMGLNKKPTYEDVHGYVTHLKNETDNLQTLAALNEKDKLRAEQQSQQYLSKIKDLEQSMQTLQEKLNREQNYHTAIIAKHLKTFNAHFAGGIPQHPLPETDKTIFISTLYTIAFHYISYLNDVQNRSDAADVKNIEAILKNISQNNLETININSNNDINKYNGLLIFIAQELARNGVLNLGDVNFRGYQFK